MSNVTLAVSPSDQDWQAIRAFLADQASTDVVGTIDSRDEMYAFGIANCPIRSVATVGYFRAGLQAHTALRQVYSWFLEGRPEPKTILDFASGYGRATRFLAWEYAGDEIWASDILNGSMEFQAEQLKLRTVLSTTRPGDFKPGRQFDMIWVTSLFTHLPKTSFQGWLDKLYSLLAPGGLLAFSVHDTHLMPPGALMPSDGLFFQPLTEIPTLDTADYGSTIVTPEFVASAINSTSSTAKHVRVPRALNFTQDLYLVTNGTLPADNLPFAHTPYGYVDHCVWTGNETLNISGWALDYNRGNSLTKVEIFLNGKLIASVFPDFERPDIVEHSRQFVGDRSREFLESGWVAEVTLDAPLRPFTDILLAKATNCAGLEFVLRCDTLNTMLTLAR